MSGGHSGLIVGGVALILIIHLVGTGKVQRAWGAFLSAPPAKKGA